MKLTCVRQKPVQQTQEEMSEARKGFIGGSDVHHALMLAGIEGKYACLRRMVLEKLGLIGQGEGLSHHLERGKFLEEPIARLYAEKTGRMVSTCGTGMIKEFPFMRAAPDRVIGKEEGGTIGVLEIKAPGEWSYKQMLEEGIPQGYLAQLNYQMLCYGTTWGSIAVYWADGHELKWFDFERDEEICKTLMKCVRGAWELIEAFKSNPPEDAPEVARLTPGRKELDSVCDRCPAKDMCWPNQQYVKGSAASVDVSSAYGIKINEAAKEYLSSKERVKIWEKTAADWKHALNEWLDLNGVSKDAEKVTIGDFTLSRRAQTRESLSSEVKEVLTPEQIKQYTKTTSFEVWSLKEGKKK